MRKSLIAAAAGAGVLSLALATLPLAQADPIGPRSTVNSRAWGPIRPRRS